MGNILEFIDHWLPQDQIDIYFLDLPTNAEGLLIEETENIGRIKSFYGYEGEHNSRVQFFVRCKPTQGKFKEIDRLLKDFYKVVKSKEKMVYDGIQLLYVGEFDYVSGLKDDLGNYEFSLIFPVFYKEL